MDGSFASSMSADDEQLETDLGIGNDERRMHVRAYNYWSSLLRDRDFPSIEDLDSRDVSDFADHSLLLDFTASADNPVASFIGSALAPSARSATRSGPSPTCRLARCSAG
jgi:hypothetical protein